MSDILIRFGKRLKALRKERGLTQKEFSIRSGLHINYIGMVERGERNPSLKNIEIFAKTLGVSLSELMGNL